MCFGEEAESLSEAYTEFISKQEGKNRLTRRDDRNHLGIAQHAILFFDLIVMPTIFAAINWDAISAIATVVAVAAVGLAVRQLQFDAWVKVQEIFTNQDFVDARRQVFKHMDESGNEWLKIEDERRKGLIVCRKMEEVCLLGPFLSIFSSWGDKKLLAHWDDPIAKAWFLLEPLVKEERTKTSLPEKWKAFEEVGNLALGELDRKGRPLKRQQVKDC